MHHSIIVDGCPPPVQRCTACCSLYHCTICPGIKPTKRSKVLQHWRTHLRTAIPFKDRRICKCHQGCRTDGHFHCPGCDVTIIRKDDMCRHLQSCSGPAPLSVATSGPAAAPLSVATSGCTPIWNEDVEDHLITMVQERPALYDVTDKLHGNKVVKTGLWREIQNKLVISETELKKRWESLPTQYGRYRRLPPSEGRGEPRTGRQRWILTRLQFLGLGREATSGRTPEEPLAADADSYSPSEGADTSYLNDEAASRSQCRETRSGAPPEDAAPGAPGRPSGPQAKRRRRVPGGEGPARLMCVIGDALDSLASKEDRGGRDDDDDDDDDNDDDISAYCRNLECRMRKLPAHVLPHFLHEVDTCLFRYTVGLSPGVQACTD